MEEDLIAQDSGDSPNPVQAKEPGKEGGAQHRVIQLTGMYENWFLDYASYVIMERAVPDVLDGLKPVQRRILHALYEMEDGRFHKVANIIGQTMQFHPHGDASIGEALVQLGQKELLIDTQGNWGNLLTGDSAAAPRYIEARLSKFALEVLFNPKTTQWKPSYDGRKKEPVLLPSKFPLLLAQGVEGIAVGLASKILPHNFLEIIDAAIGLLRDEEVTLYPDFPTGGFVDVTKYNDGLRGSRIRVRARIHQIDKRTLAIREIPFGTTTTSLIDSILAANDKGKIRIRKIDDNTASDVEILIHLASGVSPDQTMDALYAFTDCEISISPNSCVIHEGKPHFMGISQILSITVDHTVDLLARELEIRLEELKDQWHAASLERIFIEKRIYRRIEKSETWEAVIQTIDEGLKPYANLLRRPVTEEDIIRLTEIRIKKISRYDLDRAADNLARIEEEMKQVEHHLIHLTDYAIDWFTKIRDKYGKGKERRTEIRSFENIEATMVAAATQRLYVNRQEGFAGTSLRKDEYVCDCSDIDDIIVFRGDGSFIVTKVAEKVFVGKDILHIDVFRKNDERTVYNLVYQDGKGGKAMIKRFSVTGVTRDKEYDATGGTKGSKVLYLTANPNGEAEVIRVMLRPRPKLRKTMFDFDFTEIPIRGRNTKGITLTKYTVKKIIKKEEGVSTLSAIGIWYDDTVNRINSEKRGLFLGKFEADDRIIGFNRNGSYRTYGFDITTHFDEDMFLIRKFVAGITVTVIYREAQSGFYYIKRFIPEVSDKLQGFIGDGPGSQLILLSLHTHPVFSVEGNKKTKSAEPAQEQIDATSFIAVKGIGAKGKRLSELLITQVSEVSPKEGEPEESLNGTAGPDSIESQPVLEDETFIEPVTSPDLPDVSEETEPEDTPETEDQEMEEEQSQEQANKEPDRNGAQGPTQMRLF